MRTVLVRRREREIILGRPRCRRIRLTHDIDKLGTVVDTISLTKKCMEFPV